MKEKTHKKNEKKAVHGGHSHAAKRAAGGGVAKNTVSVWGVALPAPSAKHLQTFGMYAGGGFLFLYGFVSGLIGYVQTNFDLFATFFEIRVMAMSYINTLGFAIFGLTAIFGMLLGFWYLRYIEGEF